MRNTWSFLGVLAAAAAWAGAAHSLELSSPDMSAGAALPKAQFQMKCGGGNMAPGLTWTDPPKGTKSFLLTFIDTSVLPSGWSHWIVVNIPATVTSIPSGGALPPGAKTVAGNSGVVFAGPCPQAGTGVHHFEFTLYALDRVAPFIVEYSSAIELTRALSAMALAKATLSGTAEPLEGSRSRQPQ